MAAKKAAKAKATKATAKKAVAGGASSKKAAVAKKVAAPKKAATKKAATPVKAAGVKPVAKAPRRTSSAPLSPAGDSTPVTHAQPALDPVASPVSESTTTKQNTRQFTSRTVGGRPFQRLMNDDGTPVPVDYNGKNMHLFGRRSEVKARLAELGDSPRGARQRAEANRLRRELNDIDTAIIELNYGLVLDYVRKFTSTTSREDSRDFEGAAVLGLMRAIATYDPTRGSKFSTWAYKPIQRECLRAVRDADFKHLNPGDFEKRPEILRAVRTLTKDAADRGEEVEQPSYEAIAAEAKATVETVRRVMTAKEQESLYKPVGDGEDSMLVDLLRDTDVELEDAVLAQQEVRDLERYGLSALDEREMFVIGRRFGLDAEPAQRLSTIGATLGLSREAVRQVESKALAKLNHPTVLRKMVHSGRR